MHIYQRTNTFLLRMTVTLTMTMMPLLAQSSLSGLTVQAVDLLYLQSTVLHGVPVSYDIQSHPTSIKTLPHLLFWRKYGKEKFHPWANENNLIQATTATGLCSVIELSAMRFLPKTMEQEWNLSIKNATYGCVLLHVSRYMSPNCISKDQLALKWKSRIHKWQ
jgi:hypothetical protein